MNIKNHEHHENKITVSNIYTFKGKNINVVVLLYFFRLNVSECREIRE